MNMQMIMIMMLMMMAVVIMVVAVVVMMMAVVVVVTMFTWKERPESTCLSWLLLAFAMSNLICSRPD